MAISSREFLERAVRARVRPAVISGRWSPAGLDAANIVAVPMAASL